MLGEALTGCNLVIIPAGMPRKPGMSRDDLFKVNASIVQVCPPPRAPCWFRYVFNVVSMRVKRTLPWLCVEQHVGGASRATEGLTLLRGQCSC